MNISVIGAGFVGLVTATALASKGHEVVVVDIDEEKVDIIAKGKSPLYEEGLDAMLSDCIRSKRLKATANYDAIAGTEITLICVGTPSKADRSIDLSYIVESSKNLARVLNKKSEHHTVVIRSTVVPGTTVNTIIPVLEKYSKKKLAAGFDVVFNPEFMQEGKALQGFFKPDRIIIGESEVRAGAIVERLSEGVQAPILHTTITTAEMIKYASNAFLATKISFINEIGNICEKLGIDVYDVAKGISFDYRIGDRFLNAGIGFGGSCLPKDVSALTYASKQLGYRARLLESVLDINQDQALKMVSMIKNKLVNLENKKIGVLGLAFKPGTDDVRNSQAVKIIEMLLREKARIWTYDPQAMANAQAVLKSNAVTFCKNAHEVVKECDCVLVLTEWAEFKDVNLYRGKVVFDGRRVLDPKTAGGLCDMKGICW